MRNKNKTIQLAMATLLTMLLSAPIYAASPPGLSAPHAEVGDVCKAQDHYSPYAGRNFPTHLHTGMSMDAGAFGARLMPEDAYRFALGGG